MPTCASVWVSARGHVGTAVILMSIILLPMMRFQDSIGYSRYFTNITKGQSSTTAPTPTAKLIKFLLSALIARVNS